MLPSSWVWAARCVVNRPIERILGALLFTAICVLHLQVWALQLGWSLEVEGVC